MVPRLSAQERRLSIIKAAIPIFAKFGFKGTTTRQLAKAAGVSEALLYRHFPSKDDLYREIEEWVCQDKKTATTFIEQLKPSTSTLVHGIYYLIHSIYKGDHRDEGQGFEHSDINRLMTKSFLEDGAFAKIFLDQKVHIWEQIFQASMDAAVANGDMIDDWLPSQARMWLPHHIGVAIGLLNLPEEQIIDYRFDIDKLLDYSVRFSLRGIGLTDEAIKTHYNPVALSMFTNKPELN